MGIYTKIDHESGYYWDNRTFPLKLDEPETVRNWEIPNPQDYDFTAALDFCEEHKDSAVYSHNLDNIMNDAGRLFGLEQVYIGLATEEPVLMEFIDRKIET